MGLPSRLKAANTSTETSMIPSPIDVEPPVAPRLNCSTTTPQAAVSSPATRHGVIRSIPLAADPINTSTGDNAVITAACATLVMLNPMTNSTWLPTSPSNPTPNSAGVSDHRQSVPCH